jgi:hypothetical protein
MLSFSRLHECIEEDAIHHQVRRRASEETTRAIHARISTPDGSEQLSARGKGQGMAAGDA